MILDQQGEGERERSTSNLVDLSSELLCLKRDTAQLSSLSISSL